jgi:hypothetical protein
MAFAPIPFAASAALFSLACKTAASRHFCTEPKQPFFYYFSRAWMLLQSIGWLNDIG